MKLKTFVISLKQDEKRRENLKSSFKMYDEFKIVDAINGKEISINEYYKQILSSLNSHKRVLSPSELGCALSHLKAYDEFLKSGEKFALILEDDIVGNDSDLQKAYEFTINLKPNSILILGAQDGLNGRFSAFGKRLIDKKNGLKDESLFLISKHSYSAIYRSAAYIITKDSAKALIKAHQNAICVADFWEYLLKKGDTDMYFADIFSHPIDLINSHIQQDRIQKIATPKGLKGLLKTIKFIILTRLQVLFFGYERVFKR